MDGDAIKSRLARQSEKDIGTGCINWTGSDDGRGYGRIGRACRAHRLSYITYKGEIPAGLVVRHACDNPRCINPDHLLVGTQADNVADAVARNRIARGERRGHAKLTAEAVLKIREMTGSNRQVAALFGVSHCLVGKVRRREYWRHI